MSFDATYEYETPENVAVSFELAGPGSRFCAILIDWLLIWLMLLVLAFVALGSGILAMVDEVTRGASWAIAVVVLIVFMLTNAYFIVFEAWWRGQTPGKHTLHIRVISDDATGLTLTANLIRNLLRIVDFLPVTYALGGAICLLHPHHKRLGDIAAGTIVVKEAELDYRSKPDKKHPAAAPTERASANLELTVQERQIIGNFLNRRTELLPQAREALARRIAEPLHSRYGGKAVTWETYLERLLEGRHHES